MKLQLMNFRIRKRETNVMDDKTDAKNIIKESITRSIFNRKKVKTGRIN